MARLSAPDGTVVSVGDEAVAALVAQGFKPEAVKAPAKKATARKSAAKK